jgi:HTH-type transcriptional regulator/antitoxin HipB
MNGSMSFEDYIEMECRRDPEFARLWAEGRPRRDLAANVWRVREARGWTQQQLAMRARLKQPRIAEIERGDANPTLLTITRIAIALGVTAHRLLEEARPLGEDDTQTCVEAGAGATTCGESTPLPTPPSAGARKARGRTRA